MDVISKALIFAAKAHAGQIRKYTGEPYIYHPISVSGLVMEVGGSPGMIAAALLHDTVEDTPVTQKEILIVFRSEVADLVFWLTDASKKKDGNREERKAIDREHIRQASVNAKTIKIADLIDNSSSIVRFDAAFAKTYMAEKKLLLEVLEGGSELLFKRASKIVNDYYR